MEKKRLLRTKPDHGDTVALISEPTSSPTVFETKTSLCAPDNNNVYVLTMGVVDAPTSVNMPSSSSSTGTRLSNELCLVWERCHTSDKNVSAVLEECLANHMNDGEHTQEWLRYVAERFFGDLPVEKMRCHFTPLSNFEASRAFARTLWPHCVVRSFFYKDDSTRMVCTFDVRLRSKLVLTPQGSGNKRPTRDREEQQREPRAKRRLVF